MIIPLAHENLRGRRWPWVTIAIIALNFVVFLCTNGTMDREMAQIGRGELHILLLSARFPDTQMPSDVQEMVETYKRQHASIYKEMASPARTQPIDEWDAQLQSQNWTQPEADAEMARLSSELQQARDSSIMWKYAFHPFHPTLVSYITANFLHGGWMHIIFNMWFLWLAGIVLEDAWGRVAYPIFYLVCGVVALAIHGIGFSGSLVPVVGASALVSAARIRLTNLHQPARAAKLFQAAAESPAPHSDFDAAIREGLDQCAKAAPSPRFGVYSG